MFSNMSHSTDIGKHFTRINLLIQKIHEIFQCQICFEVKNEQSVVFYPDCHHFFCLDCIEMNQPCAICVALDDNTSSPNPVKVIGNENVLAVFQSIKNYQALYCNNHIDDSNKSNHTKSTKKKKKQLSFADDVNDSGSTLNGSGTGNKSESGKKVKKKIPVVLKRNHKGETPLHLACRKGDITLMQELVNAGADPNLQDNAGWTPLHDSIVFGRMEVVKFLLEHGARVNTPGHENMTPLHQSIAEGSTEITRLLLKHGADKNAKNIYGDTPLDIVKKHDMKDLEEILLTTPAKFKLRKQGFEASRCDDLVLYDLNLNKKEKTMYLDFVKKFNHKALDRLTPQSALTHVIVSRKSEVKVDWSFVLAVLMPCRVIDVKWITDGRNKKPMEKYELTDDPFIGFSRSRLNQANQLPGLFSGCHFYFGGNFELYKTSSLSFLKVELKFLVERNGGIILSRKPDPESLALEKTIPYHAPESSSIAKTSYYTIYCKGLWDPVPKYNMPHMKTLPVEWLLASIVRFELIDPNSGQSYAPFD